MGQPKPGLRGFWAALFRASGSLHGSGPHPAVVGNQAPQRAARSGLLSPGAVAAEDTPTSGGDREGGRGRAAAEEKAGPRRSGLLTA